MTSTEKLKARAKAIPCQMDCSLKNASSIITKQKALTTTVRAFFSEKYFFIEIGFTQGETIRDKGSGV